MFFDIVAAGSSADLSVGGIPSGVPGPATSSSYTVATSSYHSWHPNERLTRRGGPTHVYEMAIFVAADAFQYELNMCYPRCTCGQRFAATLTAALSAFAGVTCLRPGFEVKSLRNFP